MAKRKRELVFCRNIIEYGQNGRRMLESTLRTVLSIFTNKTPAFVFGPNRQEKSEAIKMKRNVCPCLNINCVLAGRSRKEGGLPFPFCVERNILERKECSQRDTDEDKDMDGVYRGEVSEKMDLLSRPLEEMLEWLQICAGLFPVWPTTVSEPKGAGGATKRSPSRHLCRLLHRRHLH